jgi:hypothetical protein
MKDRENRVDAGDPSALSPRSGDVENSPKKLTRRALLKGAVTAAAATAGAAIAAQAQKTGLVPEGGVPPLRLPLGALDHLDRKQYIHNMEIVAHLSGSTISGGEPLMAMWARGKQRMLPANGGFVDISDAKNPSVASRGKPGGGPFGLGPGGAVVYNARLKKWIAMATAASPLTSATPEHPTGAYDKVLRDKSVDYKGLRGIRNWDVTDPVNAKVIGEFSTGPTGNGTHHNFYDGGQYAYLDAGWDDQLRLENHQRPFSNGIMIVDMSDPANVKEISKWWVPGQRIGEEAEYKKYIFAGDQASWTGNHGALSVPKRVEDGGRYGYGGFGAFGMYVMDLSDLKNPKPAGHVQYEFNPLGDIPFHTVYPVVPDPAHPRLANLIVATHEALEADCRSPYHTPYVVDVKDPRNPKIIGFFPRPKAPEDAPYSDFCFARGRFGSHNTQCWLAPGQSKSNIVAIAFFNAGIRIFDIADPTQPKEVAWFVPPRTGEIDDYESWWRGTTENVFVEWDRNLIYAACDTGIYVLSCAELGKPKLDPMPVTDWALDRLNEGWDGKEPETAPRRRRSEG